MEAFGQRLAALRREQGISQSAVHELTGLAQPRLSKIEQGKLVASADVIDKLAAIFKRSGLDLAIGTDREAHYRAQRVTPEAQEREKATRSHLRGLAVMSLSLLYDRVCNLFDALYGGMAFPSVGVEHIYIELTRAVRKAAEMIADFEPGVADELYLPDHLEPEGPEDDHLLAYGDCEVQEFTKSRHLLLRLASEYARSITNEERDELIKAWKMDWLDGQIAELRDIRKKSDAELARRFERAAEKWRRDNPPRPPSPPQANPADS